MEEKNIFDLSDLSDLPQNVKSDLNILKRDNFENKIIDVFRRANRELTLDELTVGYYRLHDEEKERKQIMAKLYNMSRANQPAIKSIEGKKGIYKLILEDDE